MQAAKEKFGPKRAHVTGGWRNLSDEGIHNLQVGTQNFSFVCSGWGLTLRFYIVYI
jgi:hypothetical protein